MIKTTSLALFFVSIVLVSAQSVLAVSCTPRTAKQCVSNIAYWYNSCGALEDIYQNCNTTGQICQNGQCVNKPAAPNNDPTPTPVTALTPASTPQNAGMGISLFAKKSSGQELLSSAIETVTGDTLTFFAVVRNTSTIPTDNATVKIQIPESIAYQNNLAINNVSSAGDLALGINLGSIPAKKSVLLSFGGTLLQSATQDTITIGATIGKENTVADSDSLNLHITQAVPVTPTPATATVAATSGNSLAENLKKIGHCG
jgi:uncharacterized repeat protein (TIGR01451 family)